MAKRCPECGVKHSNKALQCLACGAELKSAEDVIEKKKTLIVLISCILLLAAVIISVIYFTGPRAKFRSIMRSYKRGDVDGVMDTFPEFYTNAYDINQFYFDHQLPDFIDSLSELSFSFKINKVSDIPAKDLEHVLAHLEEYRDYGYEPAKLQKVKVVLFTMRGASPGFLGFPADRYIMIKYDGKWYWWPFVYN